MIPRFIVVCIVMFGGVNLRQEISIIVQTTNGPIRGRVAQTMDQNKTYYSYQGIPYAQPPVDEQRFRAPLPPNNWADIWDATKERSKCLQMFIDGSEDCLYLNVFSPAYKSTLLPVMVWFFGGYFIFGTGSQKEFGPDFFLDEDVIVVMFNYRVGVFGFLSTEDSSSPGNYGLKDQIMALKWVKENIKSFGGNPESITVFGESAGGASISYLVQSPLAKDLFHRAIMESGTSLNYFAHARHPKEAAMNIAKILGIFSDDTREVLARLRKCDAKVLQLVSMPINIGLSIIQNIRNGISFAPSQEIESPEAVVTEKSHELLKHGNFNRIPMLIGFNSQEANVLMDALDFGKLYVVRYDIFPTDVLPIDMNIKNQTIKRYVANKIKEHYFGWTPAVLSDDVNLAQFITDDQFVRGITEAVRLISNYTDVYFYRFSYKSPYSVPRDSKQNRPGVGHDEETQYFFIDSNNKRTPTPSDNLTRKRLVRLWSNFAKTGNPTPNGEDLLQNIEWMRATPTDLNYLDIGKNLTMETNLTNYSIPFWFNLYNEFGTPPYDTY